MMVQKLFYSVLFLSILLNGLDAFSVFSIPLPWISNLFLITLFSVFIFQRKKILLKKSKSFIFFAVYMITISIFFYFYNFNSLVTNATTNIDLYILLRIINVLVFTGVLILIVNSPVNKNNLVNLVVYSSLLISLLSLISYFSYIFEYSDFYRNRLGTGVGFQSIVKACTILRNYGTFREPSFLAVWISPTIPFYILKSKSNKIWYIIIFIPILTLILTRSLTGVLSLLISILILILFFILRKKRLEKNYILLFCFIFITLFFSNFISYKFPPLDPNQCPPYSPDYCSCEYYDDDQDRAKNSENIFSSLFVRADSIMKSGINSFESLNIGLNYIKNNKIEFLGKGLGISNLELSDQYIKSKTQSDLTFYIRNGVIIERYNNNVVSFNNLYFNILISSGILGIIWFVLNLLFLFKHLIINFNETNETIALSILVMLIMYFFQAEELSLWFAYFVGLSYSKDLHDE